MGRVASAFSPVIRTERGSGTPLHKQIYDMFRALIGEGKVRPGEPVPSSRALAQELAISRIPVINAYAQLLAEGYFESRAGSGTFVSLAVPEQMISVPARGRREGTARSGPRPVSQR